MSVERSVEVQIARTMDGETFLILADDEVVIPLHVIRRAVGEVAREHLDAWVKRVLKAPE